MTVNDFDLVDPPGLPESFDLSSRLPSPSECCGLGFGDVSCVCGSFGPLKLIRLPLGGLALLALAVPPAPPFTVLGAPDAGGSVAAAAIPRSGRGTLAPEPAIPLAAAALVVEALVVEPLVPEQTVGFEIGVRVLVLVHQGQRFRGWPTSALTSVSSAKSGPATATGLEQTGEEESLQDGPDTPTPGCSPFDSAPVPLAAVGPVATASGLPAKSSLARVRGIQIGERLGPVPAPPPLPAVPTVPLPTGPSGSGKSPVAHRLPLSNAFRDWLPLARLMHLMSNLFT
uniref:Uncharacterized protein n=1 Tax=Anopheles coluzzii TaxID=1518534 RepID=A0A8W7PYB0_ANOCL